MEQLEFFEIPSPCIGVCQVNNRGYCKGCFRSREERTYWHQVDNSVKQKIVKACTARKKRVLAKKRLASQQAQQNNAQTSFFGDEQ